MVVDLRKSTAESVLMADGTPKLALHVLCDSTARDISHLPQGLDAATTTQKNKNEQMKTSAPCPG